MCLKVNLGMDYVKGSSEETSDNIIVSPYRVIT